MPELFGHQRAGVDWLRQRDRALLADEPGLGKSAQVLLAAEEPILVVAPAMVLDSGTWDDEIERWAPGADATQAPYSSLFVRGPRGRVRRDANGAPQVQLRPELRRHWNTVVLDEAHYVKGRKTSWTAAVRKLRAERLYQATGTPIPNWAHEAFVPLQLLYPEHVRAGEKLGSYWRWAGEWFDVGPTRWSPMEVGDLRADRTWEEFRRANWGDRILLRLRDQCLDLPPLMRQRWRVGMGREQARTYRALKKDFVAWLDSGAEIAAWNSADQLIKLVRCATGLESIDPGARGSGKLDALGSVLEDRPRPTLVVGFFRSSVEACARLAAGMGKVTKTVHGGTPRAQRREAIRGFQSGAVDVLCATIDIISEGMTLHQGGADQVVLVERSWRPSRNEQVIRRLHRIGQERPVTVIDLVTRETVDEHVLNLLQSKTDQQMRALGTRELHAVV